jgi:hypothetical protein
MSRQTNWPVFIPPQIGIVSYAEGNPGEAKSAIIRALAELTGRRYLPCYLESLLPEDLSGVPVPRSVELNGRQDECVVKLLDETFLRAKEESSIVLLDEMNQASHSMMAAAQEWINPPPDNAWVFAAGNPLDKATNGVEFSAPFVNRLCVTQWECPGDIIRAGWRSGFKAYPAPAFPIVPPDYLDSFGTLWGNILADFADRFPELFAACPDDATKASQPWPSPRSWTNVGKLLAAADSVGADAVTKDALIKGCVGMAAGTQFQRFVTSLQLPDPEELLAQPHTLKLPVRFDLSRAIVASVIGRVRANATPQRWESAYDVLEVAFSQQPETAMASEGTLWKLKPTGHMPKVRNGAAAEMRSLRLQAA